MKRALLFCLYAMLFSCGGAKTNESELVPSPLENNHLSGAHADWQFLKSGMSRAVYLEELGIDSAAEIQVDAGYAQVSREQDRLLITAPMVDYFLPDTLEVNVVSDSGSVSSKTTYELAYFPGHNGLSGWSLQGEASPEQINLVILGDGYQQHEKLLFFEHVDHVVEKMERDAGIGPYMSAWSIHGVFTPSYHSGVDSHPDAHQKNTYFEAHYDCFDIERLICADTDKAWQIVADQYDAYDVVAMLVNDERHGGAGGSLAIFSYKNIHTALHELGHTFAGLADEYVDESIADLYEARYVEGKYPNVSTKSDPNRVPWKHWIEDKHHFPTGYSEGVGIFAGSFYHAAGFYRPMRSTVMRNSVSPFGPINTEAWVKNIYKRKPPLSAFFPSQGLIHLQHGNEQTFSVHIPFDLSLQTVRWLVDGDELKEFQDKLAVSLQFPRGQYQVRVVVDDKASVRSWVGLNVQREMAWSVEVAQ